MFVSQQLPVILLACALGLVLCCASLAQDNTSTNRKLILSSPLTHSDWVLKDFVDGDVEGIHHMLDMCKASGWSRVYWRVLDSGRVLYKSRMRDPMGEPEEYNIFNPASEDTQQYKNPTVLAKMKARYHYDKLDTLREAVNYGHKIGIEIHAWFSINEDDHGWGWPSMFAKANPDLTWVRRDGRPYRTQLSFVYSKVRAHKLAIIKEVLDNYDVDGVFLDWIRTGDVREDPQTDADGVANYGYEEPLVQGFKTASELDPYSIPNSDPRWVKYRCWPTTVFMRDVRKLLKASKRKLPLAVMVGHPWMYRGNNNKIDGNQRGMLLDVETWAKEKLIDSAVAAGYYRDGGNAEMAYNHLKQETGGKVDVWLYGWVPSDEASIMENVNLANKVGASQILFWEADYIDDRVNKQELQQLMSKYAKMPAAGSASSKQKQNQIKGKVTKVEVVDYSEKQIYHSPETPGYTSWVGLIQLPDGKLQCNFRQITGPSDKPVSSSPRLESADNGETWKVISSGSSGGTGFSQIYQMSDDSLRSTVVLPDWTIVYAQWPAADIAESGYTVYSKDRGKTWSEKYYFMPKDQYRCWPTLIRPLRDGRLVMFAGCYRRGDGPDRMINYMTKMMFISKDKGKSWSKPIELMKTAEGVCEESDFCELANGDLLWIHRAEHYPSQMTEIPEGAARMGINPPDSYWYSDRLQTIARKSGDTFIMEKPTRVPFPHSGYPLIIPTKEGVILHCATDGIYYTADEGQSWNKIDVRGTAYYPKGFQLKNGKIIIVGHIGSDDVYGTVDQSIFQQTFKLKITRE